MTMEATREVEATAPHDGFRGQPQTGAGASADATSLPPSKGHVADGDTESRASPFQAKDLFEPLTFFVAPPSLLTALLFWIGWVRTEHFWRYFGVHQSVLGFSATDYMLRAMDTVFPFLGTLFVAAILALLFHRAVNSRLDRGDIWTAQLLIRVLLLFGFFVVPVAIDGLFPGPLALLDVLDLTSRSELWGPLCAMLGTLCLGYASNLSGRTRSALNRRSQVQSPWVSRALFAMVSGLLILSTFWMADRYAAFVGNDRAVEIGNGKDLPVTDVYSKRKLQLQGRAPTVEELQSDEPGYRYQYLGLRLLLRSGGNYFLLPEGLPEGERHVLVLPDSPELRFEYGPPDAEHH